MIIGKNDYFHAAGRVRLDVPDWKKGRLDTLSTRGRKIARSKRLVQQVPKQLGAIILKTEIPDVSKKLTVIEARLREEAAQHGGVLAETAWLRASSFVTKLAYHLIGRNEKEMALPSIYLDPEDGLSLWWKSNALVATLSIPESSDEFASFSGSFMASKHSGPLLDDDELKTAVEWLARSLCQAKS